MGEFFSVPENWKSLFKGLAFVSSMQHEYDPCFWTQKKMLEMNYIMFLSDADFLQHSFDPAKWKLPIRIMQCITTIY